MRVWPFAFPQDLGALSFPDAHARRIAVALSPAAVSSITHTVHIDLALLVTTWSGSVTDSEMVAAYRAAYADHRWAPGFNEVTDMRTADVRSISADGLRRVRAVVAESLAGFTGSFKTAVLAPSDLQFGVSRMYEMMAAESPEAVRVFRDVDEAAAWLEVPVAVL